MPLTVVAEVVAHGGSLPQLEQLGKKRKFFTKKNGVVVGLFWFIFFTMFCTAFFGIVNAPEELIALCAITGLFGSMMIVLASLIFLPSSKLKLPFTMPVAAPPPGLYGQPQQSALPPQQSQPAGQYRAPGSWRDTNDLQPTSVTESTTRLLSDEERPR